MNQAGAVTPATGSRKPAAPHEWRRRVDLVLLGVLLVAAAIARIAVIARIPHFFGPGDPGIYYMMARGVLQTGLPLLDFVHHHLTVHEQFPFIADYYEAAFAYLLALVMLVGGQTVAAAKSLSLLAGVATIALVFACGRRFGADAALLAAALVAVEPWSIYYSGLIMKEALVSLLVLAFLWSFATELEREEVTARRWVTWGAGLVAVSMVQYELLPILGVACGAALLLRRREAAPPFAAAVLVGGGALTAVAWVTVGVPLSAKLYFFTGANYFNPLPPEAPPAAGLLRYLPLQYIAVSMIGNWYLPLLALAIAGGVAVWRRSLFPLVALCFGLSFLYFHGVAIDLYSRDFITLTVVLAPLFGIGMVHCARRRSRAWTWLFWAIVAWAALVTAFAGSSLALKAGVLLALAALIALDLLRPRLRRGTALALLAVSFGAIFHAQLPWSRIYENPQFPDYADRLARQRAVAEWLRDEGATGPIMAPVPGEVTLFTGLRAVRLPAEVIARQVGEALQRYEVSHLIVPEDQAPTELESALGLERLDHRHGFVILQPAGGLPTAEVSARRR